MSGAILGGALDDFVGAVLAKKSDKSFLEQVDREFLETAIRTLKEKLKQYEVDSQGTATKNAELQGQLSKQKGDQKDIFQYLNGELAKKTDEIVALEERVLKLEEENDMQIRDHEARMLAQKDSAEQETARLQEQITAYKEQLEKVSTFIEYRASLEAELEEKKRALDEETKEHAKHVSDLERKHVQEKDRLKKEMLLKLRETKANLLKMTDNQLDTTTKRTIAENEQMSSELAWQSKETEKLLRKNDKLTGENQALRRELSLHKQTQEEFAKKVHVYQKTIKTLLAKLNAQDSSQQAELEKIAAEEEEAARSKAAVQQRVEALEEEAAELRAQLSQAGEEAGRLEDSRHDLESKHLHMLSLQARDATRDRATRDRATRPPARPHPHPRPSPPAQDEAVKFTLQCLEDMQEGRLPASGVSGSAGSGGRGEGASLQSLDPDQRETVMRYLLEQLRAYQHQLRELELHRQWQQHSAGHQTAANNVTLPPIGPGGQASASNLWGGGGEGDGVATGGGAAPVERGGGVIMAVDTAVRPWGKRAHGMPLTRHTPESFQRAHGSRSRK